MSVYWNFFNIPTSCENEVCCCLVTFELPKWTTRDVLVDSVMLEFEQKSIGGKFQSTHMKKMEGKWKYFLIMRWID